MDLCTLETGFLFSTSHCSQTCDLQFHFDIAKLPNTEAKLPIYGHLEQTCTPLSLYF